MPSFLLDTNVILRWADPLDSLHETVREWIECLKDNGDALYVAPQVIAEFWNVWTRPLNKNGFGHSPAEAYEAALRVISFFWMADDGPRNFGEWLRLARESGVSGVKVHDTRLVAVMTVHGITHLLSLNGEDFTRYEGITVVNPSTA